MDAADVLLFATGLAFLIGGAELLVRGASRLAARFGVSSLIIGLTIVAFGTGSPELAVAARAAIAGQSDIAVGNVVGSNIFNTLFILGVSALIVPLIVHDQLVRMDVPIMILASGVLFFLCMDLRIGHVEGALMVVSIIAYTGLLIRLGRKQSAESAHQRELNAHAPAPPVPHWAIHLLTVGIGLTLLVLGAHWLVQSATAIAQGFGVSELVIGLTVIAAGTSLPEVATSIVAGIRGERDIAVGNVVGSNVYNILAVLGTAGLLAPGGLTVAPAVYRFDLPLMVVVSIACLPIFMAHGKLSRWEGAIFVIYWCAYTAYLVLRAAEHDALTRFGHVMTLYVIPLTLITLGVTGAHALRRRLRGSGGDNGSRRPR
ncbi:MAG: calcium/sodium antiporter [Gemmatimonadetes bacterium]|nr:calcium/sodium antiporter [Gemmatimonadota bacterium]